MRTRLGSIFVLAVLLPAAALARGFRSEGLNVTIQRGEPRSCADLEVTAAGRAVAEAEQRLTVARTQGPLRVRAQRSGGVSVTGWEGDSYQVVVCKAAVAGRRADADAALAEIAVRLQGNELITDGPAGEDWLAYLLIRAPRDADMDLTIQNGPLSVEDASGRFAIRGENGPLSLRGVSGEVSAELENGPIDVSGGSGTMRVRTQNGPIAVHLEGTDWTGAGLEARAVNGPLALKIDESYAGAVVVESSGHSPWSCGAICRRAERSWDEDSRRVELGQGTARVRLYSENGPVAIGSD